MQMESASCDELPLRLVSFETRGTMVEYKNSRYRVFDIAAAGKSLSQIRRDIFAGVQGNPPRNTPTPVENVSVRNVRLVFFPTCKNRRSPRYGFTFIASNSERLLNALRTGDGSKETFPLRGRRILF